MSQSLKLSSVVKAAKLQRAGSAKELLQDMHMEERMQLLRQRFQSLKLELDRHDSEDGMKGDDVTEGAASPGRINAAERWRRIREIVRPANQSDAASTPGERSTRSPKPSSRPSTATEEPEAKREEEEEEKQEEEVVHGEEKDKPLSLEASPPPALNFADENDILLQFWEQMSLPNIELDVQPEDTSALPDFDAYDRNFVDNSKPISVVVSKIPEAVVLEQKKKMDESLVAEQMKLIQDIKHKETDVIWREHLARKRIKQLEEEMRVRFENEKTKLAEAHLEKERTLANEFRNAREQLEAGIQKQMAIVREKYGENIVHEEAISRKFTVKATTAPQPVEMRIHLMRAVKTKLPRGAYVLLLTQYESLGGKPLGWSKFGLYGIGPSMPAVTQPMKHYGRYFDRSIRFEDSVFALCPPRVKLKPSFVFVLELFQLANKSCPSDRVVAWTAMPMCGEHLGLVEGKFKLPLIRGEHSPLIQHFRRMERAMSKDLNNWLCNIYFEIKHLPMTVLRGLDGEVDPTYLEYDFVNRHVITNPLHEVLRNSSSSQLQISSGSLKLTSRNNVNSTNNDNDLLVEGDRSGSINATSKPGPFLDKGLFHRRHRMSSALAILGGGSPSAELSDSNQENVSPNRQNKVKKSGSGTNRSQASRQIGGQSSGSESEDASPRGKKRKSIGFFRYLGGRMRSLLSSTRGVTIAPEPHNLYRHHPAAAGLAIPHQDGQRASADSLVDLEMGISRPDNKTNRENSNNNNNNNTNDKREDRSTDKEANRSGKGQVWRKKREVSFDKLPHEMTDSTADNKKQEEQEEHGDSGNEESKPLLEGNDKKNRHAVGVRRKPKHKGTGLLFPQNSNASKRSEPSQSGSGKGFRSKLGFGIFTNRYGQSLLLDEQAEFSSDDEEDEHMNLFERGYDEQDEFYLHDEQKGKLLGIESVSGRSNRFWAKSGLEGNVNRRWVSDGARFDSEAIASTENALMTSNKSNQSQVPPLSIEIPGSDANREEKKTDSGKPLNSSERALGSHGSDGDISIWNQKSLKSVEREIASFDWKPLENEEEMENYTPAIAADPGMRKRLLPAAISKSKLKYLYQEAFGSLEYHMWGTFDFYVSCVVFLLAFWLRIYVHFIAEFLYLKSLGTPVYGFNMYPVIMQFKYMSSSISMGAEVGVVAIGPIANVMVFLVFMAAGQMFYKLAGFLPENCSTFFSAYGVAVILNPLLILIIDLCYRNFNCKTSTAACTESYTSSSCHCFTGDAIKLWDRTMVDEGSGITGLLITILLYIGFTALSCLCLYEYMVRVHKDGRILDIWRRINGQAEDFFLPDDFEISHEELQSICVRAKVWRGLGGSTRRVVISEYVEHDPFDASFEAITKHYAVYQIDGKGKKSIFRHFLQLPSGSIIEIFDQFTPELASQHAALKLLKLDELQGQGILLVPPDGGGGGQTNALLGNNGDSNSNSPVHGDGLNSRQLSMMSTARSASIFAGI